jgi:hypothetical protein
MPKQIVRKPAARALLGVGNTVFHEDYVYAGSDEFVPGTDVPRLKPVPLGTRRAVGYFTDEIDALIEGLRRWRDANPPKPRSPIGLPKRHAESAAA